MCSRLSQTGRRPIRVGGQVRVYRDRRECTAKWTGFARSETLEKWSVWEPVEVPITGFAEKNHDTGVHTWRWTPTTIRGIVFKDRLRIVTRATLPREQEFFGHDRMPEEVRWQR